MGKKRNPGGTQHGQSFEPSAGDPLPRAQLARATSGRNLPGLPRPMSVSLGSRSSNRASGWKQAGQPNLNPRLTIMPDTPLTNGQGFAQMEMRMDQLSRKMDAVLEELRSWRDKALVEPKKVNHVVPLLTPQRLAPTARDEDEKQDKPRVSVASNMSETGAMVPKLTVRQMDLHNAYKYYAKEISTEIPELEDGDREGNPEPVLRMVRRTTLDLIWETLDDPNSSNKAWWISQFQSILVLATLIFGTIQTSETPIFTPTTVAVVETSFDSVFCLEFVFRILSAPSKWMYFSDPVNWADIVCVLGLPLRASVGFVFHPVPQTWYEEFVQVTLMFFLPIFRFLKLLRYFEITRLLIDACSKAAEAVPVLSYMMLGPVAGGSMGIPWGSDTDVI
eukprot:s1580_g10.t1